MVKPETVEKYIGKKYGHFTILSFVEKMIEFWETKEEPQC
jgi:hypothetical protein